MHALPADHTPEQRMEWYAQRVLVIRAQHWREGQAVDADPVASGKRRAALAAVGASASKMLRQSRSYTVTGGNFRVQCIEKGWF